MIKFRMDEDNPCTRDCPDRFVLPDGSQCRTNCERYHKYQAKKAAERDERFAIAQRNNVATAASEARSRRCERMEQKKARGGR